MKASPITALRRLFYGATLVGMSGLSLFTKTYAQTTECTEDIVKYENVIIQSCSGNNVSYKLNNSLLYTVEGSGWGLDKVYDGSTEIPILNSSGTDFNSISVQPGQFKTFKFIFAHSDGRSCYIRRDIEVISLPTLTITDKQTEGCEGVLTKAYPTADGDFDHLTWTVPTPISETEPPFTLSGTGNITIQASASKDGCPGEVKASITYTVQSKPKFDILTDAYAFPQNKACKSCEITLSNDVGTVSKNLINSRISNAQYTNDTFEVSNAKIVWGNNPNPASKLTATTTFKGTYSAKVQTSNNCGSSGVKNVSFEVNQKFIVEDCEPTISPSSPPCLNDDYIFEVSMPDGKLKKPATKAAYNFTSTPDLTPAFSFVPTNSDKKMHIIIPKIQANISACSFDVPFQIACPHTTKPIQDPTSPAPLSPKRSGNQPITLNSGAGCGFTSSYEYCSNDYAIYTIRTTSANNNITGVTVESAKAGLFNTPVISSDKKECRIKSNDVITSTNKAQLETVNFTISYSTGGSSGTPFTEEKKINARTDCGASISVKYKSYYVKGKLTDADFACAGDTILLTLSKNSAPYKLLGMDIPFGDHTSGDIKPLEADSNGDYQALTYRFISYHCYVKSGTNAVDSAMPFRVRYTFNGIETSTTLYESIRVKTCPPDRPANNVPGTILSARTATIVANNWTTMQGDSARLKVHWSFNPPSVTTQPQPSIDVNKKTATVLYRIYPFSETAAHLRVEFNEGDSIRDIEFDATYTVGNALSSIVPDKRNACIGEVIKFTIDSAQWKTHKTKTTKEIRFVWPNHPEIELETITGSKAVFITKNAKPGNYLDYPCELHIQISDKIGDYVFDTILVYTLYPPEDFIVHGLSDVFKADTLYACQGTELNFADLVNDPSIIDYIILRGNENNQYVIGVNFKTTEAEDAGPIKAYANLGCAGDPVAQTATLIVESQLVTGQNILREGSLCLGNTVDLSLNSNGLITWIKKEPGKTDSTLCLNCLTSQKIPVLLDNPAGITIVATQTNSCVQPDGTGSVPDIPLDLIPITYPDVTMAADFGECPYTPFDFKATVNNTTGVTITGNYTFFNLRTGQSISTTALSDANGLNQYILQPQDSLLLCYNSSNSGCNRRDSARLVAYPSPVLEVTANGEEQVDNGTYCLTKGTKRLTLRASGANDYTWLTEPVQTLGRSLVLEDLNQDSTLQVKGVENRHNCVDTFALKCVIAVGQKSPSAAICPGDPVGACFEADSLPGTTYVWSGPDNFSQNGTNESKGFIACGVTKNGTYTLNASRNGCASPLSYTLSYHPTPSLSHGGNSPVCQGGLLAIEFKSDLSVNPAASIFTFNGTPLTADRYTVNDKSIFYEKRNVQLSDTGFYKLFISTSQSCSTQDSLYVEVDTAMPIRIRFDGPKTDSFCEGSSSKLIADIAQLEGQSYLYSWFIKNPDLPLGNNENTLPVVWRRDMDNRYVYVRVKQRTCTSIDSVKATVIPLPVLGNMPADTGICHGFPFYLNPTADATPEVVIWYFMDDNGGVDIMQRGADLPYQIESVDPVNSGRYFFNVINRGCLASSDTTRLTVNPLPKVSINGPIFICSGSQITLTANADLEGTYQWQHSGENTAAVVITKAGEYSVIYTTVHGCIGQASASIEGRETPYFQLPGDTSICRGTSFVLVGPEGLDSVMWHDGLTDNNRVVEDGGWYILTGYKNECPFTDSLFVKMTFCGQFHIPSAFSPNGNQVNDTWGAISAAKDEDMSEYDLMVFDRDGRVVFHGKKISDQWDGRYKGKMCPPGVYPYTFRATEKFEGIRYQASGTVTIVL